MGEFSFYFQDFAFSFLSILLEGIPFILMGTLLSGVIDAFLPAKVMTRLLPRNPAAAIFLSGLLGIIFPMCECGIVPVIRRLIQKGLPVSCGITYMLAAPIVNPVVAISTFAAFRGQDPVYMTSMRLMIGFGVAVLIGFILDRVPVGRILKKSVLSAVTRQAEARAKADSDEAQARKHHDEHHHDQDAHSHAAPEPYSPSHTPFRQKVGIAVSVACKDFLDVTMFLVIGAGITAIFNTAVDQSLILPLAREPVLASATMMTLAGILSLCSTSDAFIAATLVAFSSSAKLAFLVFGPMMDMKLLFLYAVVFRKRFVLGLGVGLFVLIGLITSRLDVMNL